MRSLMILALAVPLAAGLMAAPGQNTARGTVTGVRVASVNDAGEVQFTVQGRNPCGAVHFEYGDGRFITHPIESLPVTLPFQYTDTGTFNVRVQGMANCEGNASTAVRVTRVRLQPAPAPAPVVEPTQGRGRGQGRATQNQQARQDMATRFVGMDMNRDGVVTRAEWRGSQRSFELHDWDNDGLLSNNEVRVGAAWPDRGGDENDWTMARFRAMDGDRDGRLERSEWRYDLEDFLRVDRNADGRLELSEFLVGDVDDDRGDRFVDLDLNNDNRLDLDEWHGNQAAFRWLDRNGDGMLSPAEVTGSGNTSDMPQRIVVSAQRRWTDTGIDLRAGDSISVTTAGRIQFSPSEGDVAEPDGVEGRGTTNAPLPSANIGTLLGRIGITPPFVVGNSLDSLRVPRAGRLFLTVNDDILQDNSGEFQVSVIITRR